MKKRIPILTLVILSICVTNAQDIIRTITAGEWTKTLEKDVTYILEQFGSNIAIREGATYLNFLVLPETLTFNTLELEGVLINGVRWAKSNVNMPGTFAAKPEDAGLFYQWGSNVGWSSTDPLTATDGINTWRDLSEKGNTWQTAKNPCPAGWRVPTETELNSLTNTTYVTRVWTTENGVNGYRLTDKTTNTSLFLPAAGGRFGSNGSLSGVGTYGNYWSSTPYNTTNAYYLYFSSTNMDPSYDYNKAFGFTVRCVAEQQGGFDLLRPNYKNIAVGEKLLITPNQRSAVRGKNAPS